jgi:hypothetical protein
MVFKQRCQETPVMTMSKGFVLTVALISGLTFPTAHGQLLPTTGGVASRLGPLELENGYPTDATVAKVFDDIDFQRACQAYLWALPLMAMQQWQSEHLSKFAAGKLDYVDSTRARVESV